MQTSPKVSALYLHQARYEFADADANRIYVDVNYREGCFEVNVVSQTNEITLNTLITEASRIVQDLIDRKSKVNLI